MTEAEQKAQPFTKRVKNAVIADVFIGFDENRVFTSWVVLNFGSKHRQGFGGLDLSQKDAAHKFFTNLLTVVGVQSVNELGGKAIRVYHDDTRVYALGNFVDDQWFSIETLDIKNRESPEGITETVDQNDNKHYALEADTINLGAEVQSLASKKSV